MRELNGTSQISLVTHNAKGEMREIQMRYRQVSRECSFAGWVCVGVGVCIVGGSLYFKVIPNTEIAANDANISIQKSFKFSYSCANVFPPAFLTNYQYHHSILPAFPEYERAVYNYFIPFCATVKTITHEVLWMTWCTVARGRRPRATVHRVIHSTEGWVSTVALKGMK